MSEIAGFGWRLVGRLAPLGVALAIIVAYGSPSARADTLPPEIAGRIDAAASEGRNLEAEIAGSPEERAKRGNRRLNAEVLSLIAEHPALVEEIVSAALGADPEARDALIASTAAAFPGFMAEIALAEPEPEIGEGQVEQIELTFGLGLVNDPPYVPLDRRPPSWPIFPEEGGADGYAEIDPLYPLNIAIFYVNGTLDWVLFEPVAEIYSAIMWDPAERAIGRAFNNLREPLTFVNDLLQFEFERAGIALGRFLINSTFGVLGLFDVAEDMNLPRHKADFGQTLHSWGIGDGIYLVLPLFGPTTLRDAVGIGVDFFIDPRQLVLEGDTALALNIGEAIARRAEYFDVGNFLELYAESPYAASRAWAYQQRMRFLNGECDAPNTISCTAELGPVTFTD
ncbi:MAG: VacJ family lipoprotein [Alphaproteobacteria bacterium]